MRVKNITSSRSRRPVANQFKLWDGNGNTYFQSYDTIIAKVDKQGNITLDNDALNYSVTTSKYLYLFTGLDRKEIQTRIKDGTIKLENLN